MLDISLEWLPAIVNASLRAVLIAAIAWTVLTAFKLRDSNIRHRVWSGVLLGMLCLPVLSGLLPPVPLPFEVQTDWLRALDEPSAVLTDADQVLPSDVRDVPARRIPNNGAMNAPVIPGQAPQSKAASFRPQGQDSAVRDPVIDAVPQVNESQAEDVASVSAPASWFGIGDLLRAVLIVAFAAWLLGLVVLLLRTMTGLMTTTVLLRRSRQLHSDRLSMCCAAVLQPFESGSIRLMCSNEIRVPVTVGWWQPTVLLPATWQEWSTAKLEAVLAHESTHVVRRDFMIAVLAEVNLCVYWFHPMAWWLRRNLADLAEEACDDAAIVLTGNPAGYARHLLEVAAALTHGTGRLVQPGMSMARESNVESRIMAILDFTRPLSRQLTWNAVAMLLLITVPVIALSAALQPIGSGTDDAVAKIVPDGNGKLEDAKTPPAAKPTEGLHVHGQVLDHDKRGLASAKVQLYRTQGSGYYAAHPVSTLVEDLSVDSNGRFDRVIPRDRLPAADGDQQWAKHDWLMLVVSAPGRVYTTHSFSAYGETEPLTVRPGQDVPINGRLLSLEGQPVSGVTISVVGCERGDRDKVDEWLVRVSQNPPKQESEPGMTIGNPSAQDRFPSKRNLKIPLEAIPPVTSDDNGEFQLTGFGPDDLVLVEVSGGGVVKSTLHVLGRDLQTRKIIAGHRSNLSSVGEYFGNKFSYVTQPAVPVFGVIRDIETKQPLANVDVAVGHVSGRTFSHTGYVVTKTDQQGRYRIEGLPAVPKGSSRRDRNSLSIRPGELPYIENDSWAIPPRDGLDPIEFNMEFRKAVLARGRLTDKETGQPIKAKIYYSPFRTNDHCADYSRFADDTTTMLGNDSRYQTDEDGYFFIPVIAGRGVIAAKVEAGSYRTEYGAADIPEFRNGAYQDGNTVTSDHIVPSLYHSLKAVDVPAGATEVTIDMQVDPGMSLIAKFIDPNGAPLKNVEVSGAPGDRGWVKTETDSTPISGLAVGQVRPILATHAGPNRISRLIQLIPEQGQQEFTIQLFDRTVLTGRLIDADGNPLVNQPLEARHDNNPEFINSISPSPATDDDGNFQLFLHVGAKYHVIGRTSRSFTVVKDLDVSKPQRIDLGDLIVDSDADDWALVQAKRKPTVKDREPYQAPRAADAARAVPINGAADSDTPATNIGTSAETDLVFNGMVTDPAGQPFAGAKIYLIYWDHHNRAADPNEKPLAVSGSDGRFEFRIDATEPANGPMPGAGTVVAVASGYAFAHVVSTRLETTGRLLDSWPDSQRRWIENEIAKSSDRLQLLKDVPVRGRIVNSEGQGVAGATIRVQEVSEGVGGSLQQWVAATKAQQADYYSSRDKLPTLFNGYTRSHLAVPSVLTNADGWFELRGLGRNRVAEVVISGPAIASSVVNVRADSGETIRLLEQWPDDDDDRRVYYGNGFTHVAASSQLVTGRVIDKSTGAPLSNCLIQAERLSSQKIGGRMSVGYIRTNTDNDGRYTLHGLPLGQCSFVVIPPNDAPYVPLEISVNKREPAATSERNLEFVRGVLVEGQVTDSRTGKPVAGRIEYSAFATNGLVKGQHRLWLAYMPHHYRSGPDGRYRIPVLPGPGVLGFTADDHQAFPRARWTPTPSMPARDNHPNVLETLPSLTFAGDYHHVTGIDPQSKLESMRLDFQLTSGIDISGHVERPDGSRVDGCTMYGESIPGGWYQHPRILNPQSGFQVQGYRPDRPQRLIAWLEDENLIGTILLHGEQPKSLTITLSAAGSLTGRLVNSDGEPMVGVFLTNGHSANDSLTAGSGNPETHGEFPDDSRTKRKLVTDDDGRFSIPGLVQGLAYAAEARGFRMIGGEKRVARLGSVFVDVVVAAGETKDLGDIVLQEREE